MEDVPMGPVSFVVTTLREGPQCLHLLKKSLPQRFKRMPECDVFIRSFHDRLKYSHDAVAVHGDEWKAKYCDVLKLSSRYCAERHYWSDWLEERLSRTRLASSTPRWTASLWALVCSTQAPGISGRRTGPEVVSIRHKN
ncbi:hypothetical protein PC120_g10807 [Phytophthora cactorum]|nr:hypothetical protein PC120_g10807 [Phytophthora cactorum]